jgi:two-component system, cell cycle response regulator DivK
LIIIDFDLNPSKHYMCISTAEYGNVHFANLFEPGLNMLKKVLIADDYDDIRDMMVLVIEGLGYQVIEAKNGAEAVDLAAEHKPNVILMDLAMPFMDGVEATQEIRSREDLAHIPIIAITAFGSQYADQAREAGCDQILPKPVDIFTLKPILETYVH